jgi:hypothetical protein
MTAYVGPGGPVKVGAAPVSVMAWFPVFCQVGATAAISLGCRTPFPEASTPNAAGAAATMGRMTRRISRSF